MKYPAKIFEPKDPSAIGIWQIDWSRWLVAPDVIATSTWDVPAGITRVSDTHSDTATSIKLSGGAVGTNYDLTNTITTAGGLTECRTIRVPVAER